MIRAPLLLMNKSLFCNRQNTCRKSWQGKHHISSFCLWRCFLQGNGVLVFHTVGYGQRTWSIILESSTLDTIPIALDTQGGRLVGRIHHLDNHARTILLHGGAHAQIPRFTTISKTVLGEMVVPKLCHLTVRRLEHILVIEVDEGVVPVRGICTTNEQRRCTHRHHITSLARIQEATGKETSSPVDAIQVPL